MFFWMKNPMITPKNPYDSWLSLGYLGNSKWLSLKSTEITLFGTWDQWTPHVPARNVSYFVTGTYPNIKSGCHHHQIGMDYLYDVIFKMAASEVKYVFAYYSASRIDRDNILVSEPMFFWMKNPMMPLSNLG